MASEAYNRLIDNLRYNLGDVVMKALGDPEVVEILLNSDGKLWIERLGQDLVEAGRMDAPQGRLIISLMASALETVVTVENPIVEGELPFDGSRFEGVLPPVCQAPVFSIRKKASQVFTLDEYAAQGIMPDGLVEYFRQSLVRKQNIMVVGGTGSGKTTFVNALIDTLATVCPDDRLIILEDTMELQSSSVNTQFFRASGHVDMTRLLRMTMRMRPDRILIGEVRDGAALALLKAWNTGHPGGIATVHANSAEEGLYRLEELIAEATSAPKHRLISHAVDIVVYMERAAVIGRKITEVLEITGYNESSQSYGIKVIYSLDKDRQNIKEVRDENSKRNGFSYHYCLPDGSVNDSGHGYGGVIG